ncbi:hypothetical protein UlMin_039433 [Ulmus minor]
MNSHSSSTPLQITSTKRDSEVNPKWLEAMFDANFYEKCEEHNKDCTQFCIKCMKIASCENCIKHSQQQHQNHKVIKVVKSSHQAAIRIMDLKTLLDISDIHPYSINSKPIVYLCKRDNKDKEKSPLIDQVLIIDRCQACGYRYKEPFKFGYQFKFCSIQCKAKICPTLAESFPLMLESFTTLPESFPSSPTLKRKKLKRKGIPHRAPMF